MGIYIKGMEMPKNCLECVFYRNTSPTYDYCCISTVIPKGYVPEDCPLVEEKTGEWILNDNGTYSCSLCQSWIPNEQHHYARYCLHCGARMVDSNE